MDAANNTMGQIIRWQNDGDFDGSSMRCNHLVLAGDPSTGEVRRFLTGPVGCEITGGTMTPDGRKLFINVQHPGETPAERSDPAAPRKLSNWPDLRPDGRPSAATGAIRRRDGGVIGS